MKGLFNHAREVLQKFSSATRPLSNVKNIAIVLLAFYFSHTPFDGVKIMGGIIALSCIFSCLYIYNSISDAPTDKQNMQKAHYASAIAYFGEGHLRIYAIILAAAGLMLAGALNIFFALSLLVIVASGWLYSSPLTRFKEKPFLDILFGATLTYPLRFYAAWTLFSPLVPPLLPFIALASAKSAGYILYKNRDRNFLYSRAITNSITILSPRTLMTLSAILWGIAGLSFIALCVQGYLPYKALLLSPLAAVPLIAIYWPSRFSVPYMRFWGLLYFIATIVIAWKLLT